jgi:DNA-binding beta-propeller fold protein YncE
MEINERMSKRFAWLLGVVTLVSIGFLIACGSKYNRSSDGLVLVASQGSGLIESFGFSLASGSISEISNPPGTTSTQTCVLNGVPSSIVVDPAGAFAYTIVNENSLCSGSSTGIAALKINSDGTVVPTGSLVAFNAGTVSGIANPVPVVPYALVMDPAGKFLFVADRAIPQGAMTIPGSVSVFTISNGTATEVAGSPFYPTNPAVPLAQESMDIIAVAPTPTVFPKTGVNGVQNSVCSDAGNTPPSTQFLYAADKLGNQVLEFQVDMSSGVLSYPGGASAARTFAADILPGGVVVDPCNRFVYVSNLQTNKISGYTMCNGALTQSPLCPVTPDGSLMQIAGSPFSLAGTAFGPGPMVADPFGNYVYVLNTISSGVSTLKISPISGSLTANANVAATGVNPTAIAVRADDNWLFVANNSSSPATISQFTITPATGVLSPLPAISTDNNPWGVAVK